MMALYYVCSNSAPRVKVGHAPFDLLSYYWSFSNEIWTMCTVLKQISMLSSDDLDWDFLTYIVLSYFQSYSNEIWTMCTILKTNINVVLGWPWLWPFDLLSYFWSYCNDIWTIKLLLSNLKNLIYILSNFKYNK